jgi:cell division protease FtsH
MGHAIVGHAFIKEDKIHKVSIIPHGIGAMGYTIQRPSEDRYIISKNELENKMTVLLAGRAAEMLIFKELSTGASDDLAKATTIAREMIMRHGMSPEIGFVTYEERPASFLGTKEVRIQNEFSEQTAQKIDQSIRSFVMEAYQKAHHFLEENTEILKMGAKELLVKETLTEVELKKFFDQLAFIEHEPPEELSLH